MEHISLALGAAGVVVAVLAWLRPVRPGDRPSRRMQIRDRPDVRPVHCLYCGRKAVVRMPDNESGSFVCEKCGRRVYVQTDTDRWFELRTDDVAAVARYRAVIRFFGFAMHVLASEQLPTARPNPRRGKSAADQRGKTRYARKLDPTKIKRFRRAYTVRVLRGQLVRGALGSLLLVVLGCLAGLLLAGIRGAVVALPIGVVLAFVKLVQGYVLNAREFDRFTVISERIRYCSRSEGDVDSFALMVADENRRDEWWICALFVTWPGRWSSLPSADRRRKVDDAIEALISDTCGYADRNGWTLALNGSAGERLRSDYGFERADQDRVKGYETLVRPPRGTGRPGR